MADNGVQDDEAPMMTGQQPMAPSAFAPNPRNQPRFIREGLASLLGSVGAGK